MPSTTAIDLCRPFTRRQALTAGLTDAMLRGPRFRRLYRNAYIRSDVVVWPTLYVEAALLLHPASAFVSHHSAARLYGLPVPDSHQVHVSVFEKADRRRRDGIRHHLATPETAVTTHLGHRVSSPTQLFLEMAGCLHLVDLVVLGDAMVRRGLVTLHRLRQAAADSAMRGSRLARRAVSFVREGVDSPMESRLRMLLVLAGLPEPEVNVVVRRADGSVMLRLDLAYPHLKLVVEYDGQQHRQDLDQWARDISRADWFDDGEWRVIKVISRGVFRRPDETIRRVHRALVSRGCADLPRDLSDEWRAYFTVKP
jgi:hypothetical protein